MQHKRQHTKSAANPNREEAAHPQTAALQHTPSCPLGTQHDQQVKTPPALPASTYLFTTQLRPSGKGVTLGFLWGSFYPVRQSMLLVLWGSLFFNGAAYNV